MTDSHELYAQAEKLKDEGKNDEANNQKLLELLKNVPESGRTAHYTSVIVLAKPEQVVVEVSGEVYGMIAKQPQGSGGFGYDPLFFFPEFQQTFAQVSAEVKHKVSHRGQALRKLHQVLVDYLR